MKILLVPILILNFLLLSLNCLGQIKSGIYGDLIIAVNDTTITGFYSMKFGQQTCELYFRGINIKLSNTSIKVNVYNRYDLLDEDFFQKGLLVLDKDRIKLKFDTKPFGCQKIVTFDKLEKKYVITDFYEKENNWSPINVVIKNNAYLYLSDNPQSKKIKH